MLCAICLRCLVYCVWNGKPGHSCRAALQQVPSRVAGFVQHRLKSDHSRNTLNRSSRQGQPHSGPALHAPRDSLSELHVSYTLLESRQSDLLLPPDGRHKLLLHLIALAYVSSNAPQPCMHGTGCALCKGLIA